MVVEIEFGPPPSGYALTVARGGEYAKIAFREFTSTEDGQLFIQRLEQFPTDILQRHPSSVLPSQVDHLLAIFRPDGRAVIYLNELKIDIAVRVAKSVQAGSGVFKDDIADVERISTGVSIPDDAGFLFVFSLGWRKGLYYDFGPVCGPNAQPREYDIGLMLGRLYRYLLFQERYHITDDEWMSLLDAQWFPFVGLGDYWINRLISNVRSGWDPDENLDGIVSAVKEKLPQMMHSWSKVPPFKSHIPFLERAAERFANDDYLSCTSLLFTRIEGILSAHYSTTSEQRSSQGKLAGAAVSSKVHDAESLLMPLRFKRYLEKVYFAYFNPRVEDIPVNRNSVGHGAASESNFNRKSSVIGFLIVHQLFYFFGKVQKL